MKTLLGQSFLSFRELNRILKPGAIPNYNVRRKENLQNAYHMICSFPGYRLQCDKHRNKQTLIPEKMC